MPDIGSILLAAGLSTRMGKDNKLLLPIAGVPMIRYMVEIYHAATRQPVLVITGHETDQIAAALHGSAARIHFNPDFAQGQATSVACGLQHAEPARGLFVGLGDQPQLNSNDLVALIQAHDTANENKISIPLWNGQRGNPILIPPALRARLLEDPHAPGCRKFTRTHPEHVQFHDLSQRGFYADVDTPEAYAALPDALRNARP